MAKPTLTVTSAFGTFTRSTARPYAFLVIGKGYRAEKIEATRLKRITELKSDVDRYRAVIETGVDPTNRSLFDREFTARSLANGSYSKWLADASAELDRLKALPPVTEDKASWPLEDTNLSSAPTWVALGWSSRLDLARKLEATEGANYRYVLVLDVTTGEAV
jgi:hypothetical protein